MSYAPIPFEPVVARRDDTYEKNPLVSPKTPKASSRVSNKIKNTGRHSARRKAFEHHPIIVHCHLCWDWVWQRPQQFLSRLSQRHEILVVETVGPDPTLAVPLARFSKPEKYSNITILRLQFPSWRWDDGKYVDAERRRIVQEFLAGPLAGRFENAIQWFYDPMAVPAFAGQMGEILTVYDCMDELSKFRGAPPEIVERESQLLARADVVFTGGRKLLESKSRFNQNCHFYGCGVDGDHFGGAREARTQVPAALAAIKKPILGYFGVVDERIDYDLLAKLADANSDWSVAIIGPVLKVDPASLPQRTNLHWLGQQQYADLPAFCKGFDVCLMPFALNESTEFINPTKALEYMATGRMIVSTAVPDVVTNFGSVAKISSDTEDFVSLCRQAIQVPDQKAIARGLQMAADNSWEAIVTRLEGHIADALAARKTKVTI
jgi:glycosyltransferase involved in cell wall biosynthesis